MKDKDWYLITSNGGQSRIDTVLEELNIGNPVNPIMYIRFGYKVLSAQDKETYYILKDLSDIQVRKHKNPICNPSLNFLSEALGTTETSQEYRIKRLEKYKLLKRIPNGGYYIYTPPFPDSTFLNTIIKLLKRKRLGDLLYMHKTCNNPFTRINQMLQIKEYVRKGSTHQNLSSLEEFIDNEDLIMTIASFNSKFH